MVKEAVSAIVACASSNVLRSCRVLSSSGLGSEGVDGIEVGVELWAVADGLVLRFRNGIEQVALLGAQSGHVGKEGGRMTTVRLAVHKRG